MPRLNEYITVGFCSGYGDSYYRVSMGVQELSRKQFDELRLAVLEALRCAEEHWWDAQPVGFQATKAEDQTDDR